MIVAIDVATRCGVEIGEEFPCEGITRINGAQVARLLLTRRCHVARYRYCTCTFSSEARPCLTYVRKQYASTHKTLSVVHPFHKWVVLCQQVARPPAELVQLTEQRLLNKMPSPTPPKLLKFVSLLWLWRGSYTRQTS